jgi:hypothetical protein
MLSPWSLTSCSHLAVHAEADDGATAGYGEVSPLQNGICRTLPGQSIVAAETGNPTSHLYPKHAYYQIGKAT